MSSRYALDVTVNSGKDLKNVNWLRGGLRPFAVVWVDPRAKVATRVDPDNNDDPEWHQTLFVPLPGFDKLSDFADAELKVEVLHETGDDEKKIVGIAELPLGEVLDECGLGQTVSRKLRLRRPSGREHGKVEISVCVRELVPVYEAAVTVNSASELKNVNWRYGNLRPYATLWVDPSAKSSTRVDQENNERPVWNEVVVVPLPGYNPNSGDWDAVLNVDVIHYDAEEGVKPLVGSGSFSLQEVIEQSGVGGQSSRTVNLKRPSGRPQGKVDMDICIREKYQGGPAYGTQSSHQSRENPYGENQGGYAYGAPPPSGNPYGAPPPQGGYGDPHYAPPQGEEGYGAPPMEEKKKSKHGMGTGLAVGAAAGLVGGVALGAGIAYLATRSSDSEEEETEEKEEEVAEFDDGADEEASGFDDGGDDE